MGRATAPVSALTAIGNERTGHRRAIGDSLYDEAFLKPPLLEFSQASGWEDTCLEEHIWFSGNAVPL